MAAAVVVSDKACFDRSEGAEKRSCCVVDSSSKRKCGDVSRLETLPRELLIRVLFGVDHADLDQLLCVSKTIRQAALVAKRLHFAYSTPTKASPAFRNSIDLEEDRSEALADDNGGGVTVELEPPKMKLRNVRPRKFDPIKMAGLAVALFTND